MQVSSIAEKLLFTTTRIETHDATGNASIGTGFFFGLERGGQQYGFLVTNRHVVKNAKTGRILFTVAEQGKPILGKTYWLHILDFENWWYSHSDPQVNIAIAPLGAAIKKINENGVSVYHQFIHEGLIPNAGQNETFDAIEEIVFVGYPNNIWDDINNCLLPDAVLLQLH